MITGPGTSTKKRASWSRPHCTDFSASSGSTSVTHGRAEDALLVGEAPVLLQPPVEGPERGEQRGRVVEQRLLHADAEGGKEDRAAHALLVHQLQTGVAVAVLGVVAHRVEVAEELPDPLALGVAAAEVLVERARLRDGVEGRVGDEAVDLAADEQPLLAVDLTPLHRALGHARLGVAGEGVDRLVVVVVAVEDLEVDVAGHGGPPSHGLDTSSLRELCGAGRGRGILRACRSTRSATTSTFSTAPGTPTEPHDDWTWLREHAPVYYDAKSDVWAITQVRRRAGHREGRQGLLQLRRAPPARRCRCR